MSFEVHEFLPLTRPRAVSRRLPELLSSGCFAILDLEDSAMCVGDASGTRELKAQARAGLLQVASRVCPSMDLARIQIRINCLGSPHYKADLRALAQWVEIGLPLHLVLPMVDSPETISQCVKDVRRVCGVDPTIVPLLEVGAVVGRIQAILEACPGPVRRAMFGYFDFALDTGIWPLEGLRSQEYWDRVAGIAGEVEAAGARYLHTPTATVSNVGDLRAVKAMILALCGESCGASSLGAPQTEVFRAPVKPRRMSLTRQAWTHEEALARAFETIVLFESNGIAKRSFAIAGDRFIPPHEYLAAKAYASRQQAVA